MNRGLVFKGHMGAQEVVVGDEQGGKGNGTVRRIKAMRRPDVLFISSVEALNKLLERSEES